MTAGFLYFYIIDAKVSLKFFTKLDISEAIARRSKAPQGQERANLPRSSDGKRSCAGCRYRRSRQAVTAKVSLKFFTKLDMYLYP